MRLSDLLFDLIGISKDVPLDENEMAHQLKVTFQPPLEHTERLDNFVAKLKRSLVDIGTEIIPFEKSLTVGTKKRVKEGIVIVQQGTGRDDQLAINLVSSLHGNTVVGLFDEPAPIPSNPTLQQTLDSIAGAMAWNLIHVPIFVEENSWTICTMNGAVIKCGDWNNQKNDVLKSLIPKLSAQVVPPKRDEIVYREKQFDPVKQGYETFIKDFMNSAKIWQDNGLMLAHTSIDDLKHRNRYFKRIVSIYLDNRTGMSYGFMVKQLPADPAPAIEFETAPQLLKKAARKNVTLIQHNGKNYAKADLFGKEWLVHIPNIWVLSTRSGCNKTNLDPEKDILKLGLHNGEITIETPKNISAENCRPSFDTYAILAHCTGNVIIAGVLKKLYPDAIFPRVLRQNGLSLSHWHGYPDKEYPLPGYIAHGENNPPVSCSTPQSAAYAIAGKLSAVERMADRKNFMGDIHIEPHHGTNISGSMTLTETAAWVDKMYKHSVSAEEIHK